MKLHLSLALALLAGCATAKPASSPGDEPARITAKEARAKLAAISPAKVQLWVVVHVRAHKTLEPDGSVDEERLIAGAVEDARAVVNGGGDLIMLINSRCDMPLYERVITAVREVYPTFPIGISALSYGPSNLTEGFRLAKKFGARVVWTETVPGERIEYEDDDGSYKPADVIPIPFALDVQRREKPDAMNVGGVHMKYTRPLDGRTFEEAMKASLGTVDGINITGPKTGTLADVERVKTARGIAGEFPMGLASGVSTENIASVIGYIDYAIVGTSLKKDGDPLRTDADRVKALRLAMDGLGGGKQ